MVAQLPTVDHATNTLRPIIAATATANVIVVERSVANLIHSDRATRTGVTPIAVMPPPP
jgi:hypothetical protein